MKYLFVVSVLTAFLATLVTSAGAQSYGKHLCKQPGYHCKKVRRGDSWHRLFPDGRERAMVMTLNRTNMSIRHRSFIVIPNHLSSTSLMDLSPFAQYIDPPGERVIIVDLKELAFGAYNDDGRLMHWGAISGGKDWCADVHRKCKTVTGSFRVHSKRGKHCVSNTFPVDVIGGGAPMPYCMFFHGGYAMHASATVPGYHASHGCVRMFYGDARWLSKYFVTQGSTSGTRVIVN